MQIAIWVLIGVIIYQGVIHQLDKKEAVRRESELLNRIMARDYAQYGQVKITEKVYDKGMENEPEVDVGIPV